MNTNSARISEDALVEKRAKSEPLKTGRKNVRLAKRGNPGSLKGTHELGYSPITLAPKDSNQSIVLEKASEAPDHTACAPRQCVPWQAKIMALVE